MATSPFYGWSEPDNSSLVKNGASDIRTLGNAIDASLWNVGYGQSGKNRVLNAAMDVWQRSTSVTPSSSGGAYTADRWYVTRGSNTSVTVSRQATSDTTNLPTIQYCARVQRTAASTTTTDVAFGQMFESVSSIPLAGQSVTLSGYIRKGADFSAASNILTMQVITGTGTDQKQMDGGYTGSATSITGNVTLTTTWTRFSVTGTIPTTATELTPKFVYTPTGTAGANDWFEITGVQLEVGSTATPFSRNAPSIQGELAACKRYLPSYDNTLGTNNGFVSGYAYGTNTSIFMVPFDVPARVNPTGMTVSGTINAYALNTSTGVTPTFDAAGINSAAILASHTITAGQGARLGITSGAKLLFTGCEL